MFAAISGLHGNQTMMDVIGNNIANVNTVGYKSGRVNFQDIMSQTLTARLPHRRPGQHQPGPDRPRDDRRRH